MGYHNGPGAEGTNGREKVSLPELTNPYHEWEALRHTHSETHGGEDVGEWMLTFLSRGAFYKRQCPSFLLSVCLSFCPSRFAILNFLQRKKS